MKNYYNLIKSFRRLKTLRRLFLIVVFYLSVLPLISQQIIINSGAFLINQGSTYIKINNGDFINNGSYTKGTESIYFTGNIAKTISGSSNTDLFDMSVSNTAGITTQLELLITNNIRIDASSKFSIEPVKAVIVNNTLSNNAGITGLILQSNALGTASLVHNTNGVPATVKRYISGAAEAWHFLSSPVSTQSISGSWIPTGTYGNGTGYDLYLWNEPNSCWIYYLDSTSIINWRNVHPGTNFEVGRGYLYSVQSLNPTKEFIGSLNNGNINYGMSFSGTDTVLKGFNLVGNPYPSSIDWSAPTGWDRTFLMNSGGGYNMWIWNPLANNYGVYNSATEIGTNSITRNIAPMQGYFVQISSNGSMSSTNDVRIINASIPWFVLTLKDAKSLSLIVSSDTGNGFDEVQLEFGYPINENGAIKLFSHIKTAPSLYMNTNNNYFSANYFTNTEENAEVPILFTPGTDGTYSLKCNFDSNKFDIVMLEDYKTNTIQNMKDTQTYNFHASKKDDANRFVLHFGLNTNQLLKELPLKIYQDINDLAIDLTLVSEETTIFIYALLGQLVIQQKLSGNLLHKINLSTSEQIMLINLKNSNGNFFKKLLWVKN